MKTGYDIPLLAKAITSDIYEWMNKQGYTPPMTKIIIDQYWSEKLNEDEDVERISESTSESS